MSDKVNFDLEDLDDLKDILGEERKESSLNFQKVFPILCSTGSGICSH